jgi:enoyl-CoA hydratase/carnithine racemase
MADNGVVRRSDRDGVATLVLERGDRNALDSAFADALVTRLADCDADRGVRAVVLTGAGKSFCVGADLAEGPAAIHHLMVSDGAYTNPDFREPAGRITMAIRALGVPVIVAANGDAVGGGAAIMLAADLRFAADTAKFGFPFTRLGLTPEGASTHYLPRLVGPGVAADWLLSGRVFDAAEALSTGLVSRLLPADEVVAAAQSYAAELAARTSPTAVAATRALLRDAPADPAAASTLESRTIGRLAAEPDCAEGVAAFLQRRPPNFAPRS